MNYSVAPMEGITYPEYRRLHSEMFPGAQTYYAPFVAPGSGGFKRGFLEKRLPDVKYGINTIPQIMANRPETFLETAHMLTDIGFKEINLNAGCPSGTVFSKHKGSGMLLDLDSLDSFLNAVFSSADFPISIKTRMGVESVDEFTQILEIYEKYPITQLIVHSRARAGFYRSKADLASFNQICAGSKLKLCYNGDIFSAEDMSLLKNTAPYVDTVMLARGIIANPALGRMLQGGEKLALSELKAFHDGLLDAYLAADLGERTAYERMKELWFYMISLFPDSAKEYKALLKSRSLQDYTASATVIFNNCAFDASAAFHNKQD